MHAFDLYYKECIQIGVRGFYTLKESDIAKLASLKGQPDRKKSKLSIEDPVSEDFQSVTILHSSYCALEFKKGISEISVKFLCTWHIDTSKSL